ncbi:unnamed protein product [Rhizoctonia solani]|uniref:Acireductone dioxygenase n=1 Tax=Rhizoctonia solani TaxID=456999 RepID=A0A8H3CK73_9AGAM|nr:unnamed protein product [Rhizoctonia solani]
MLNAGRVAEAPKINQYNRVIWVRSFGVLSPLYDHHDMLAYIFDNLDSDQRLPHVTEPPLTISEAELKKLGVLYWRADDPEIVESVAKERGYKNRDTINVSRAGLGDLYESKIKGFFEEHMHEDEEIRYILDGTGYFDVRRTPDDLHPVEAWIRIAVEKGDLLVIPAGIYHRFTLDTNDYIKALRLFQDEPKWVPHNRSPLTDENLHRQNYLQELKV